MLDPSADDVDPLQVGRGRVERLSRKTPADEEIGSLHRGVEAVLVGRDRARHTARDLGLTFGRGAIELPGHAEDFGRLRVAL